MWHVLEHSLIDSLKVLPILFLVYVFIEIIEDKSFGIFKKNLFQKFLWTEIPRKL